MKVLGLWTRRPLEAGIEAEWRRRGVRTKMRWEVLGSECAKRREWTV